MSFVYSICRPTPELTKSNNSYHVFNTVYNYTSDAYPGTDPQGALTWHRGLPSSRFFADYASSAIAGQGLRTFSSISAHYQGGKTG